MARKSTTKKLTTYEAFTRRFDGFMTLLASVNAADNEEQQGWGGPIAVFSDMTVRERSLVRGSIMIAQESMKTWLEAIQEAGSLAQLQHEESR